MNKLVLFGALACGLCVLALVAPGCADTCEELQPICDTCGDADYQASCDETVANNNQDVCSFQKTYFDQVCNDTGDAGGEGGSSGVCTHGQALCQGACVDLESDPAFCGSCVNACADGELCQAGACVGACTAPFVQCGSGCNNTANDPLHCGGCADIDGVTCGADQVCDSGTCADGCDATGSTPTDCDGSCVNLAQDTVHCGDCGNTCGEGILCSGGNCSSMCETGLTECSGTCVNASNEAAHCGGCAGDGGEDCTQNAANPFCADGACAADCGGLTACGNNCIDLTADSVNCGACGNVCDSGLVCSGGQCSSGGCTGGQLECNGGCVTAQSDPVNCGECGNACAAGSVCSNGDCITCTPINDCGDDDCAVGQTLCGATSQSCVDLLSDPNHCGGCNVPVAAGQLCDNGAPVDSCSGGKVACNGGCVDVDVDDINHCGSCGNSCNDNDLCTQDSCSAGTCSNNSGAIACNDGNPCTDDQCVAASGTCSYTSYDTATFASLCQIAGTSPGAGQCLWCDNTQENIMAACQVVQVGLACTDGVAGACSDPPATTLPAAPATNECADGQTCNLGVCQ